MSYRPKRLCPACRVGALWIRNSWSSHPLLTVEWMQCQNILCGATYRAMREITHELVAPGVPNPALRVAPASDSERTEVTEASVRRDENQLDWLASPEPTHKEADHGA